MLARKLKFVIDRIGPVHLQEIPNDAEGPRHVFYRGPLGRISLEHTATDQTKAEWQFTAETMSQIEPMFLTARGARGRPDLKSICQLDGSAHRGQHRDPVAAKVTSLGSDAGQRARSLPVGRAGRHCARGDRSPGRSFAS